MPEQPHPTRLSQGIPSSHTADTGVGASSKLGAQPPLFHP